ncbi:hypothetical protein [Ammoniphilus resinae]|uniref:Na+-transporting NADH:ubiquinone oxidoreductase subunit NqrF n=1 Tax=Ammoniphilus resinae TaxID=861532 RepID=A0ABS4GNB5_9BACL|nr:hypothetical protein [Ammoniphilus resinae]MBP1931759.1 Na+-transporting NADH:ubiquinone oxidoreductase subunit NqrF [Ammoniphilus resinae]
MYIGIDGYKVSLIKKVNEDLYYNLSEKAFTNDKNNCSHISGDECAEMIIEQLGLLDCIPCEIELSFDKYTGKYSAK